MILIPAYSSHLTYDPGIIEKLELENVRFDFDVGTVNIPTTGPLILS